MAVALVTGASSGIGRACAEHLSRTGFRVYGTSRSGVFPEAGSPSPTYPALLRMEVGSEASVRDAIGAVLEREGRLDVVVNNAGISLAGAVEDTGPDEVRRQMEVNFDGAVRVCRFALPGMRAQGSGCIVNVSSMAGLIGIPYQAFYSASKFALEGFSAALRAEVRPFGVRVVMIRAGDHSTPFTQNRIRVARWDPSPYRSGAERELAVMERDERAGPDPAGVGRLVAEVALGRKRGDAYVAGAPLQRAMFSLRHVLTDRQIAWILRKLYALE